MAEPPPEPVGPVEPPPALRFFGITVHRKIRTGEKFVPWSAVFIIAMMWFNWGFNLFAGGQALTFTIQKYTKDPRKISLIGSIAGVVMIAPIISYISDQIWTRAGRRRPFLIVAWAGGFIGMVSFAFLPQVAGAINHGMMAMGLHPIGEIIILAVIIFCYKKAYDGCATIEPLFMECVPPHQRGRFFAMRGMLLTLAVTMFYQILWPRFDDSVDMFRWLGRPGVLYLTGEQLIYIMAAGLFLLTGLFVVFCVEETRMPQAPNKSFRELFLGKRKPAAELPLAGVAVQPAAPHANVGILDYASAQVQAPSLMARLTQIPIVAFIISFARDVFLKAENYPYYIVMIIPSLESYIWGNFGALMSNDQFGYSKQVQADWAFPNQILTLVLITPFAGWYSDIRSNIRWWLRIVLLGLSAAAFFAMLWVLKHYSPADIRQTANFLILTVVTALAAVSMMALYVPTVETMLDIVGREHARAWVSLLTVVKAMITTALLYLYIQRSPGQVPPVMVWMVFAVVGGTLGTLMNTFIGPMLFDYMRRSQMGTINSGSGLITGFVQFGAANLGAWWIFFYTKHIHKPAHVDYDYTSMYLLQFVLFVPAILAKLYFVRMVVSNKIKKWGIMEVENPQEALIEEEAAHVTEEA